jgi:preprotein translocase subunit SecY
MLDKIITVFKIPELRRKILLTMGLLAVYRMGFWIPLPFIDQDLMQAQIEKMQTGQQGCVGQVL